MSNGNGDSGYTATLTTTPVATADMSSVLVGDQLAQLHISFIPGADLSGVGLNYDVLKKIPPGVIEIDGYGEEWSHDQQAVSRYFLVPWEYCQAFTQWAIGFSTNNAGFLSRIPPAQNPKYPAMYAVKCDMLKGVGAIARDPNIIQKDANGNPVLGSDMLPVLLDFGTGYIAYFDNSTAVTYGAQYSGNEGGYATFRVTYQTADFAVRPDSDIIPNGPYTEVNRFTIRNDTYAIQSIPVPYVGSNVLTFLTPDGGGNKVIVPEASAGNFLLPSKELIYTWLQVPDVPEFAIAAAIGKTNSDLFDAPIMISGQMIDGTTVAPFYDINGVLLNPNGGYAPGTLLCAPPQKKRYRNIAGRVNWDIEYHFLYRPQGWGAYPRVFPDGSVGFDFATIGGTPAGKFVIQSAPFGPLFLQPTQQRYYQTYSATLRG